MTILLTAVLFIFVCCLVAPEKTDAVIEAIATPPAPVAAPVAARAKAVQSAPRLVVQVTAPTITAAPIDWTMWGVRDLRWVASRVGVKGGAKLTKAQLQAAIEQAVV